MLRLVLLALYLAALYSGQAKAGSGLDPLGLTAPSPVDRSGNLDPDGFTASGDRAGNLDPNG